MRYEFNYLRSGLDFILKQSSLAHIKHKRILVPAFICPVIPEVIRRNGFEVKFADADLESFNIKITEADLDGVGAVFVCHTFGAKCEIPSCKVPVIEDCAHFLSKKREGDLEGRRSKTPSALFALYSMYKQVPNARGGYVECGEDLSGAYEHLMKDSIGITDLPALLLQTKGPHQPLFNLLRSMKGLPVSDSVKDDKWNVLKASDFTKKMFARGGLDPNKNAEIYNEMKYEFEHLGLGKFCKTQRMPEGSVPYNFSIRLIDNSLSRDGILARMRHEKIFADRMWYNADTNGCKNAELLARTIINLPLNLESLVVLKDEILSFKKTHSSLNGDRIRDQGLDSIAQESANASHALTIFHTKEWTEFLKKILHGEVETVESWDGLLPIFRGSSIPLADYCGPLGDVSIPDGIEVFSLKKLPGFKESPFCTFKLAISGKNYDDILKNIIHQKTRNMINKAAREGVSLRKVDPFKHDLRITYKFSPSKEDQSNRVLLPHKEVEILKSKRGDKYLNIYYRLYIGTMLRLNRLPLPKKAFEVLLELFKGKSELYLAEYNDKFVGGIVAFIYNNRMHIWSNASDNNFSSLGVNNALYGFAIQRACKLKLHEVDFGSSLLDSSHHFFKKRFGGVEMPIYCNHKVDSDIKSGLLLRTATSIMKFLPVSLVSFLSRIAHKTSFRSVFKLTCGIFLPLFLLFLISPLLILNSGKKQIYTDMNLVPNYEVAIVFGAGIKDDGTPSDALKDRLRTAAELYDAGKIEKILVSGDNRFESYDEPTAMYTYLVDTEGIPAEDVFIDYAGRRTYDTCIRAHEIWGVDEAILISQGFHLPRAIFTCNSFGVDSSGYSATNQGYVLSDYYKFREVLAIYNAVIDVYLWEPDYMRGDFEQDLQIN